MSGNLYRVVFIGDLVDEERREVVKRNLATLFGTNAGTMSQLFGNNPVIVKKNLLREEAVRFRDAIIRCGAFCRIETMDSATSILLSIPSDQTSKFMTCPRCSKRQDQSAICRHCGVIVQAYQDEARQELPVAEETEEERNRRYYDRRYDLESSVNVGDEDERRIGRDRRRANLDWRM
jgi:hypothetical protein